METGGTLLSVLLRKGLKVLMSCGGNGLCSTCHVWVKDGCDQVSPVGPRERRTLALVADYRPESRLACQCQVYGDGIDVEVPEAMYIESADDLLVLLGTQVAQNILHPISGAVLIPKGKLVTRTLLEQSRGVSADLSRVRAGGEAGADSGFQRVFLASGVGIRPVSMNSTHHLSSRTATAPRSATRPAVPPPSAVTPIPPVGSNTPTDPQLNLTTNAARVAAVGPGSRPSVLMRSPGHLTTGGVDAAAVLSDSRSGPPSLQPGTQIGKYLLIECIGKGGAGVVYRALHTKLKTPVAVKFLRPEVLTGDDGAIARFTREAQLLAQHVHPNVVRVLDYEDEPARPYVVMEYVDGLSAADLIKQCGRVAADRTIEITLHVLEGLDAARKLGVVYRDVNPGNILVTKDGASKLVDLGLAVATRTSYGASAGGPATAEETIGYMSPEQAMAGAVDHRSDQYSLGCTLFHLVTGRLPFVGRSAYEVML